MSPDMTVGIIINIAQLPGHKRYQDAIDARYGGNFWQRQYKLLFLSLIQPGRYRELEREFMQAYLQFRQEIVGAVIKQTAKAVQ